MKIPDNFYALLRQLLSGLQTTRKAELWSSSEILEQAKRDWLFAYKIFNEATDPDLIEYAIYNLKATEKRYMFILNKYRSQIRDPMETAPLHYSNNGY
ncbi:MAG: DUF2508 family protein [Syntrophomonadaceae bacterium]|nr:DUF2508 family protein [Syntrophomonadaceae bacterium]